MSRLSTFAALATIAALPAVADTRLEYVDETTGETRNVIAIHDGKVRMNNVGDPGYTLFDRETQTLTMVDPEAKTYTVLDEAAMEKMSGQVSQTMAEMRKQLEQMPPEQRKMMEKMMGGMTDMGKSMLEMKVDRTGKTREVAGYDCKQVFVSVGKLSRQELCVVDPEDIDMPAEDRATLETMQERMRQVAEKMSEGLGMNLVMDFDSVGGMPVYMKQDRDRSGQVLKHVEHEGIDAEAFEIPDDYRAEQLGAGE